MTDITNEAVSLDDFLVDEIVNLPAEARSPLHRHLPVADHLIEDDRDDASTDEWTVDGVARTKKGQVVASAYNAGLILAADDRLQGTFRYDEFMETPVLSRPFKVGVMGVMNVTPTVENEPVNDFHIGVALTFLQAPERSGGYDCQVQVGAAKIGLLNAARRNPFHPVKEFFEKEPWDGVERLETLFHRYAGVEDNVYHREVSRQTLVAVVTRVFEPGHKFDFIPILEGPQGAMKSTFWATLAGNYFVALGQDAMKSDRALVESIRGCIIAEVAEMDATKGRRDETVKNLLSRGSDRTRLAYRSDSADYRRTGIFVGSKNPGDYLTDPTGNRRYWPINMADDAEKIDIDALQKEVQQLWAEALHIYRQMRLEKPEGTLMLDISPESRKYAEKLQGDAMIVDNVDADVEAIREWLETPKEDGDIACFGHRYYSYITPNEAFAAITGEPIEAYAASKRSAEVNEALRRLPYYSETTKASRVKRLKISARKTIINREKFMDCVKLRIGELEQEEAEERSLHDARALARP